MKLELEVPKIQNDKNKSVTIACLTRFDHCRDLFRGELSKNQVILQNIHLRACIIHIYYNISFEQKVRSISNEGWIY